ncbi:MAG: GFA family protein [Nannocystaceae bacterium]
MQETQGRCLCGEVTFTGLGALAPVEICHCDTCRRHTAGPLMSTYFAGGVRLDEAAALRWYESSTIAARGFCGRCGTTLFWRLRGSEAMSVSAHVVDAEPPAIAEHVFYDQKSPWYDFADDAPRVTAAQMRARFDAWRRRQDDEAGR